MLQDWNISNEMGQDNTQPVLAKDLENIWYNSMERSNVQANTNPEGNADAAAALMTPKSSLYVFAPAEENPFLGLDTKSEGVQEKEMPSVAFKRGMELFHNGNISDAILAFQADLQENQAANVIAGEGVGLGDAETWRMLGVSHQENDEDPKAITCLEKAVEADPYHLPALLALGVSYVNELDSERALQNLRKWVKHNPRFHGMEIIQDAYSDGTLMDEVMQLMLKAAEWDEAEGRGKATAGKYATL